MHPAADVFPMMSDEELAELGEDIKANGQTIPVVLEQRQTDPVLIDGRNRLEAMERSARPRTSVSDTFDCKDPVTRIITLNIHRRHLTKQQQADLIVAAMKAGEKPDQDDQVSKGGRGKKNPIKDKAVATPKSTASAKPRSSASIAKAKGRAPKRATQAKCRPGDRKGSGKVGAEIGGDVRENEDSLEIDDELIRRLQGRLYRMGQAHS